MIGPIKKAAVLGSGVMGSAIAAHLANVGIPTLLLDVVPAFKEEDKKRGVDEKSALFRNRLATQAISRLLKTKPSPLYVSDRVNLIKPGNFEDDLESLSGVDWIIEAVVEDLAVKRDLFARVASVWRPGTIVSTNTSGLPINEIASSLPKEMAKYFFGTHFFNPPRYMRLLEIIPGRDTLPEVVSFMAGMGTNILGKGVVICKDTPNFIANRIGTYSMLDTIRVMLEQGFSIEEVDALTGPALGRPKSASFRTLDMVGLDVLLHVARNITGALPDEKERFAFAAPELLEKMVAAGMLGDKSGGGFYRKVKKDGQSEVLALDPQTLAYRPRAKARFASLEASRQLPGLSEKIRALLNGKDRGAAFCWRLVKSTLIYSALKWQEIARDIVSVDRAMRWGFNWQLGPFELIDAIGLEYVVKRLTAEGETVPPVFTQMLSGGVKSFYREEKGIRYYYDPAASSYQTLDPGQGIMFLPSLKANNATVFENSGASLVDVGDGVACLEFHSKENAIGEDIIQMVMRSVKEVESNFEALILANHGRNFSVGANLVMVLMEAEEEEWDILDLAVRRFQEAGLALKYCTRPVVGAPFQMALGGGLEICLSCDRVQAATESYLGLVEVGVGLLPSGGGVKEMLFRAMEHVPEGASVDPLPFIARSFETIAMAKVSTSGPEAVKMGYLRPADGFTANADRLLYEAKAAALGLAGSGYRPPLPGQVRVTGTKGIGALTLALYTLREGNFISDYDFHIGTKIAHVICGGQVTPGTAVSEQYILDLEREAFLSLLGEPKTQARIRHMLKTGKPLRN